MAIYISNKQSIKKARSLLTRRHHMHPKTLSLHLKIKYIKEKFFRHIEAFIPTHLLQHRTHVVKELNKDKIKSPLDF